MAEGLECAEARELFPELAAGVAAGDERARALGHLSGCPACRREFAGTAELLDELLWLAPEHDPPAGFESSVLARLTPRFRPAAVHGLGCCGPRRSRPPPPSPPERCGGRRPTTANWRATTVTPSPSPTDTV